MTDKSPGPSPTPVDRSHHSSVVDYLLAGKLTVVLGAGANLCGRPALHRSSGEQLGANYPPSGSELASYLAEHFKLAKPHPSDLLLVSQHISAVGGGGSSDALYMALHELFNRDYEVTRLHRFLATISRIKRAEIGVKNYWAERPLLIVTTNYDDLMERAFKAEGVKYDIVVYMAEGEYEGRFFYRPSGRQPQLVEVASGDEDDPMGSAEDDERPMLTERPLILKLHGFVERGSRDSDEDSYVITEDHYIEYLTHMDLDRFIPDPVLNRLRHGHLLFLGYSMRDWNLRAMLYQLVRGAARRQSRWAVQVDPSELERESWQWRGVRIYDVDLDTYVEELERRFAERLQERT